MVRNRQELAYPDISYDLRICAGDTYPYYRYFQSFLNRFNFVKLSGQKKDVAKFQILMEVGGIFLESDSVVIRSLNELRTMQAVFGESHNDSLGKCWTRLSLTVRL